MPTPFTHLRIASQLLTDEAIPQVTRDLLVACRPAFLLGATVADARVPDKDRETTHFYRYDKPMVAHPWRVMVQQYPSLMQPIDNIQRVFIASYVAHLAADEYWSRYMLKPHFAGGTWGKDMRWRFFVLHLLLIIMDERDEKLLPADQPASMRQCHPQGWLPFLPDDIMVNWRDFIAEQLDHESQTLAIFGERIAHDPAHLRALVDDDVTMQSYLWDHITPDLLADLEKALYDFSRQQMLTYLEETASYNAR